MMDIDKLRSLALDGDLCAVQEVITRLEAADKERDELRNEIACVKEVEFPRKAQAVADAWKGKCERLEAERDALRALVVMRFDHECPPHFTQGHDLHELTEPVTVEHCRWFVAEIARLRADCGALRTKIEQIERQEPVAWMNSRNGFITKDNKNPDYNLPLYLTPGAMEK